MEKLCSKDSETYLFAQKKNNLFGHLRLILCFVTHFSLKKYPFNQILPQKGKLNVLQKNCAFSHKKFSKITNKLLE
jgi:hypothetical protein